MPTKDSVILITRKGMGEADPALQTKLISTYFRLLDESDTLPGVLCFYAEGVYLVCDGSPVLESLINLEQKGVQIVVCNTCLTFYDLLDQLKVGLIGGMTDIIEAQRRGDKVITI
jgi:intracellular sulfur oxidation DsrE/DsrF family protein